MANKIINALIMPPIQIIVQLCFSTVSVIIRGQNKYCRFLIDEY